MLFKAVPHLLEVCELVVELLFHCLGSLGRALGEHSEIARCSMDIDNVGIEAVKLGIAENGVFIELIVF